MYFSKLWHCNSTKVINIFHWKSAEKSNEVDLPALFSMDNIKPGLEIIFLESSDKMSYGRVITVNHD